MCVCVCVHVCVEGINSRRHNMGRSGKTGEGCHQCLGGSPMERDTKGCSGAAWERVGLPGDVASSLLL